MVIYLLYPEDKREKNCFTHVCLSGLDKDFLATINSEISFKISFILKTLKMNDLQMIEAVHVSKTLIF